MDKLAIDGGSPVRATPFPPNMPGASLIGDEELQALADVVRTQSPFRHYGIGTPEKVDRFEADVRDYFGVGYALGVSSGSGALMCAIAAIGAGPGDEIIIPSFAWYSDFCALVAFGVTPVFADIGEDLNIDPADIERKITPKTRAIIAVHYQGMPARMDEILRIARAHKLFVIEDCAQALGGEYAGEKLGTLGDIAIFSFQTHKLLTAGEGGLVITNDETLFERAVRYHDLGFVREGFARHLTHPELADASRSFAGVQLRMSELTGAFIGAQFKKLPWILERCRATHRVLREHIAAHPGVTVRYREGDCGIALILLLKDRETAERFGACMEAEGIAYGPTSACCDLLGKDPIRSKRMVHPDLPPFGAGFDGEHIVYAPAAQCPNTDGIVERIVALGIGPLYGDEEIADILHAFDKVSAAIL